LQLLGVGLAFFTIMYLSIKRVALGKVMFVATAIIAVTSGMSLNSVFGTIWSSFKDRTTLELAAAVLTIGVFSTTMKELGFLERTVKGLSGFLGNIKAAVMTVPALIGSMPVLGGAAVSAPLVDKLGEPLNLSPERKAAINLVFRHGMFFVFPFSPSLILASKLTGFTVGTLISRLCPMSLALWGVGYITLLRKIPSSQINDLRGLASREISATKLDDNGNGGNGKPEYGAAQETNNLSPSSRFFQFVDFLHYGSPLLMALAMSLLFKFPLWLSLFGGTIFSLILSLLEKQPLPHIEKIVRGANLNQVFAMFWIMSFKAFVSASPVFSSLVESARNRGISPVLMAILLPLVFGYGSASQTTTVGVLLPVLMPKSLPPSAALSFLSIIYGTSFVAYFCSPLHLCQVLTCQYFGIDIPKVYKFYWPVLVGVLAVVGFYALSLLRVI